MLCIPMLNIIINKINSTTGRKSKEDVSICCEDFKLKNTPSKNNVTAEPVIEIIKRGFLPARSTILEDKITTKSWTEKYIIEA